MKTAVMGNRLKEIAEPHWLDEMVRWQQVGRRLRELGII